MILFCFLLGVFAVGAPGVPGGTVMASLGLIISVVGFDNDHLPGKKMRSDPDTLAPEALPALLPETERLLAALRAMTPGALQALWRCSDAIAAQNLERLRDMDLRRQLTPALLSYVGLQYQYMAPGVLEQRQYDYLQTHLRILSGFYGVLRPFDGVTPYRLEMGARLKTEGARDLYGFWGTSWPGPWSPGTGRW